MKLKLIVLIFAAVIIAGGAAFLYFRSPAGEPPVTFSGPKISVVPESYDFGKLEKDELIPFKSHTFTIKNIGSQYLLLPRAEGSEGISATLSTTTGLAPGEVAVMEVSLDSRKFEGEVSGHVVVYSNDPEAPQKKVPLSATVVASKELPPVLYGGPDIEFDSREYDFGVVRRSELVEYGYEFRNVGDENLVIEKILVYCDCFGAWAEPKVVPPGRTGKIMMTIAAWLYPGHHIRKSLTVVSNDPDERRVALAVRGDIEDEIEIRPEKLIFGKIRRGPGTAKTVTMRPRDDKPFEITGLEYTSEYLTAEVRRLGGEEGKEFEIEVTVSPQVPFGDLKEKVIVHTDHDVNPTMEIPVEGKVVAPIAVAPGYVNLGITRGGQQVSRKITVSGSDDTRFSITGVDSDLEYLSMDVVPLTDGLKYQVVISMKSPKEAQVIKGVVNIHTDNSEQPVITVEVLGAAHGQAVPVARGSGE